MRKTWVCEWEIAPSDEGPRKRSFTSFKAANAFVRELISERIDASGLVSELKSLTSDGDLNAACKFLTRYINDPSFPGSENDLPSGELEGEVGEGIDFFLTHDQFGFQYGEFEFYSDFIWSDRDASGMERCQELRFSFFDPGYCKNGSARDVMLTLTERTSWGSSAHPVMVLQVLQSAAAPMNRDGIASEILRRYGESIERKAVGRMIKMLKELGYAIKSSRKGFFLQK